MSHLPQASSNSDIDTCYAMIDEKKRKRMQSNRESARRSRIKKQKRIEDLVNEISDLKIKIDEYKQKYVVVSQKTSVLETENNNVAIEKMELTQYLWKCDMILLNYKQAGCFPDNWPEISEPQLQQWQVCGPMQPIMASGMFKF